MLFRKNKKESESKNLVDETYLESEISKVDDGDVEILMDNNEAITKKLSSSNSLSKYLEIGKIMMAMVKDIRRGSYHNVPWFTIATIVMALLYVLNPLDIVPDFIPGIGYLDDVAMLSIGIGWIESDLHRYLDWKVDQGNGI
tara:strand:- start:44147 stop:44572 length:426 start_codon:yes stop_codon:yes gene_type:complete